MKIIDTKVLNGPNIWSNSYTKLIQIKVDMTEIENVSTKTIDSFLEKLKRLFPKRMIQECPLCSKNDFFEKGNSVTSLAHVLQHLALEMQVQAGMECRYGCIKETQKNGICLVVYSYTVEEAGLYAAESALQLINGFLKDEFNDLDFDSKQLKELGCRFGFGPSTKSIVEEAERRGIPWFRLGKNSKVQLGHGANQRQFQATMTCNTSDLAVRLAGDKDATKKVLSRHGVPVPKGESCSSKEELKKIVDQIGFPIVIKPLNGNQGKGATIDIEDFEAALIAFNYAQSFSSEVIVEKFINGYDYRLLVIDGKFVAAAKRTPASITGNGSSSIDDLINQVNCDSNRGKGHESSLTKIIFDQDTFTQLSKYGYTVASIPNKGEVIYMKSTANLSTGGTAEDVTDDIHQENIFLAERIAKIIGLDICGIDVMAESLSEPLRKNGGAVLEVNAAPGFRMHLAPSVGKARNVASAVVDMLYPQGSNATIPLFAVTGTNGKTTTTRLLAHIAKSAGYSPGFTTTDGIYSNAYKIKNGDCSGPDSGSIVLQDPTVNFAVLETARGGLLRKGLCFDQCDVGIITNIAEDHLGLDDIHTLSDLAKVKSVVVKSVAKNGWAVLNAEDDNCLAIAKDLECNVAFFSMDAHTKFVENCIDNGTLIALCEAEHIVIIQNGERYRITDVASIPLTDKGKARFMIANILAATAGAFAWGFSPEQIKKALQSFIPGYEMTPGRLNFFKFKNFTVLVDYAHNPHGLSGLKEYLEDFSQRKIGIIAGIGDRRDEDTIAFAKIAATIFDHVIIRQEHSLRGRTEEEINALIIKGLHAANPKISYDLMPQEADAIAHAFLIKQSGDLIVALSDQYDKVIAFIQQELEKEATVNLSSKEDQMVQSG